MAGATALGTGLAAAVSSAAGFEKQLSAVGAVAGATAQEMQSLTSLALQLGKDTSFSAKEAAIGLEELVKAGVSIQDAIGGGARAALDLAAAGAISVGDAAEIAANALNVFGLKGTDMAHVADQIAGAANASAISVNDYKFSLSAAGAVAATVGIGFEDLTTAIAAMGNAGIKGSDAGTSLKTMLLNLTPSTKAQIAAFRELGILTADGGNKFFDASGKAKTLAEIAGVLKDATKDLTQEQKLQTLQTMFGTDAIRAAAIMANEGAEGFAELAAQISKVTAQKVAEERLNNLSGSLEKLKGSLETAAIILGMTMTPAIKRLVDAATDIVNDVIPALEQIPDVIQTIQQVFGEGWLPSDEIQPFTRMVGELALAFKDQFGGAIQTVATFITGTLVPALQTAATFLMEHTEIVIGLVAAFATFSTVAFVAGLIGGITAALTLMLSPIGLLTIAIATLTAAWIGNWGGIRDITLQAWAAMEPTFTALVDWLGVKIPVVLNWITTTGWPAMVTAGTAVSTWITGTAIPALTQLVDWLGPKLVPVVTWITDTGWPTLVTVGTQVGTMIQSLIQFFAALFVELEKRQAFVILGQIWDNTIAIGTRLVTALANITAAVLTLVGGVAQLVTGATSAAGAVDLVAGAITGFFAIINSQLALLRTFLDMLDRLGKFQMPSFNFGGGGGGAQLQSWTPGGGGGSNEAKLGRAAQIAAEMGFTDTQIRAMQGTLLVEGGLQGAVGDSGQSHGPFQLYEGGQFQGFKRWLAANGIQGDPKELAKDIDLSTRYALGTYYGAALRQGPQGSASDLATYAQTHAQVSINPWKAGQAAPAQIIGAPTKPMAGSEFGINRIPLAGAPGSDPSFWPGFMHLTFEQLPAYMQSLETIQQGGAAAFEGVATAAGQAGATLVSTSTDHMGNVMTIYQDASGVIVATITDTAGNIVNSWGSMAQTVTDQTATMATAVPEQTNLMASGALVSVTDMGTGIMTIAQTTAGTTIATITDMQGQVTSQTAQMANGAVLQANGMQAGVLTSVTQMHDGTITTVQDMSGNTISTVTDMAGNVTNQYVSMASEGGSAATQLASTTSDAFGEIKSAAEEVPPAVKQMGDSWKNLPKPNVSGIVSAFEEIAEAAEDAADEVDKLADKTGAKSGSGKKNILGKAEGGYVAGGQTFLVGERGPELFSPSTSGFITPNHMLGGGINARDLAAAIAQAIPGRGPINVYGAGTEDVVYRVRRELERERAEERSLRGIR